MSREDQADNYLEEVFERLVKYTDEAKAEILIEVYGVETILCNGRNGWTPEACAQSIANYDDMWPEEAKAIEIQIKLDQERRDQLKSEMNVGSI